MSINQQVKKLNNSNDMTENFSSKKKELGKSRVGAGWKNVEGVLLLYNQYPKKSIGWRKIKHNTKIENCLHHLLLLLTRKKRKQHTHTQVHAQEKRKKKQREEEEEEKKFLAQNTRFNNNSKSTPQY